MRADFVGRAYTRPAGAMKKNAEHCDQEKEVVITGHTEGSRVGMVVGRNDDCSKKARCVLKGHHHIVELDNPEEKKNACV